MGTYYALADGDAAEVAVAIREHYLPRGAGDELPETHAGLAVAIADKLDTLAGIFEIGEKPTGAKDPFGLRRAAIGLLRILIEKRLNLDLRKLIAVALGNVRADVERIRASKAASAAATGAAAVGAGGTATRAAANAGTTTPATAAAGPAPKATSPAGASATRAATPATEEQVYDFIMERLRAYYLERATGTTPGSAPTFTTEMFDAVLATKPARPLDFDARLKALRAFLDLPEATSLAAANKRIANILRKAGTTQHEEVDVEAPEGPRRGAPVRRNALAPRSSRHRAGTTRVRKCVGRLAQLRPPVDDFFEQVMVMDEDPLLRRNRLALLAQLHGLFIDIADLSRLPG